MMVTKVRVGVILWKCAACG